jgi:hypothetical protein
LIVHLYRVGANGGHGISVVIKLYSLNRYQGNRADGPRRYDPNNDRLHVTSHVSPDSKYFEVHPMSAHTTVSRYQEQLTDEFGDMFAIKFTQERLERLLDESSELTGKDMGLPRDWRLGMVATHVELSEGFLGGRDADSTARVISDISGVHVWR